MDLVKEDIEMINSSIDIMKNMYGVLRNLDVQKAKQDLSLLDEKIRNKYGRKDKKDTRYFDVVAEEAISLGHNFYGHDAAFKRIYDQSGVIITEERGKVGSSRIEGNTPVIISDPVDKSSYLDKVIETYENDCTIMGQVFDSELKNIGIARARLEACNSSVTLLKDNMIKYSLILNLFTGELFAAYERGLFSGNISDVNSIDDLTKPVEFKSEESLNMLCYCEGCKYENNRVGTHLRFFPFDKQNPYLKSPGGPNRFTYLLKEENNEVMSNIGVIAHNGEKIQESLPNIAVAFFSQGQLRAYKLFCDNGFDESRGGKLLTPNLRNSIYENGLLKNTGIDLTFLNNHSYPSEFRDTTVIVPKDNESAMTLMEGMVKREYAVRIV